MKRFIRDELKILRPIWPILLVLVIVALTLFPGVSITWEKGSLPVVSAHIQRAEAAVEDFSGNVNWIESDSLNIITISGSTITVVNMTTSNTSRVYRDMGVDHFGTTFTNPILVSFNSSYGIGSADAELCVFTLANTTTATQTLDPTIRLYTTAVEATGHLHLYLMIDDGATDNSSLLQISANTSYYASINRSAAGTIAMIYSDAARTVLTGNVTVQQGTTSYRYVYALNARGTAGTAQIGGSIWDYDFQEAAVPEAPTVVTGGANAVVAASANVSGNITDIGSANVTSWGTQYGTTTAYSSGNTTNTGSQGSPFAWTDNLTGLLSGELYHYRGFAVNSAGIGYGGDSTFTTTSDPLIVIGDATSVNQTTATMSMNITTASQNVTSYSFRVGTNSGNYTDIHTEYGSFGVGQYTHPLIGLTAATIYYVSANATSPLGTDNSTEGKFVTQPSTVDSNFISTDNTTHSISLNWTAGADVNNHEVRWSISSYPTAVTEGTFGYSGNETSTTIGGLDSNTRHYFSLFSRVFLDGTYSPAADTVLNVSDNTDFEAPVLGTVLSSGTLVAYPTIECIGVTGNYTGDTDNTSTAILQVRLHPAGAWITAPDLYSDFDSNEYRGSIFWLTANTEYDIQLTFVDPDGVVGANPLTVTVTTRNDNPALGAVHTYYVATDNGSDAYAGNITHPWLTIQKAANTVVAGDTVYVRAGTYAETVTITADGIVSNYISFLPYPGESVTVTGSGVRTNIFYLNAANYIRIKGFNTDNCTGTAIYLYNSHYCIVENNSILNPNTAGTGIQGGVRMSQGTSNALIQYNTVTVTAGPVNTITGITWWQPGYGLVIRYNTVTGTAGGLGSLRDGLGGGQENVAGQWSNNDIYSNNISGMADDGIQAEGDGINVRIWNNITRDGFIGIAVCPVMEGPTYVFRNTISKSYMFKTGDDVAPHGRVYYYQNSFYNGLSGDGFKQTNGGLGNIVFRNNAVYSGRYVIELRDNSDPTTMSFDYDAMYTTDPTRFVSWAIVKYTTFALFKAGTGQESHGISVSDFHYTDEANGDLTLESDSPLIDIGTVLVGFNDANSPWPHTGVAPDMGAYEYDSGFTITIPVITVTTGASLITTTTARLNGNVTNPGGENCTVVIRYDTVDHTVDQLWSNNVTPDIPVQPMSADAFFYDATLLLPNTLYYYTASGNNSAGTGWATTGNFTTLAVIVSPTITIQAATLVGTTTARLNANLTDDGEESCNLTFVWGLTNGGTNIALWTFNGTPTSPAQPQIEGAAYLNITALPTGTVVFFSCFAVNSANTSWPAGSLSFLTIPAAPTNVTASDGSSTSNVTVSWTASFGTNHYHLFINTIDTGTVGNVTSAVVIGLNVPVITPGTAVATDGTSNVSVGVSLAGASVANGTTYTFTVRATNATGDSTISAGDTGYIGHGVLTYQWERSVADADAGYVPILGATAATYADAATPLNIGRYWRCTLDATGAIQQTSLGDRGYRATPATVGTTDAGTTLLRSILTVLIAAITLLLVLRRPGDPIAWIVGTIIAGVAITVVQMVI
jgi:hypothetical protein